MNCQNIRAAIDTGSPREPLNESVRRHLSGCPSCQQYADQTHHLIGLLGGLPRVTAPPFFEAQLQRRIAAAQTKRQSPFAFLENFWSLSFTWGQAATTMATLALLATLTTLYFVRSTPKPGSIAMTSPTPNKAVDSTVTPLAPPAPNPVEITPNVSEPLVQPVPIRYGRRGGNAGSMINDNEPPVHIYKKEADSATIVGNQIIIKKGRQAVIVTVPEVTYGAQPAVTRPESPAGTTQVIF
jgi:hypothetical protein